MFGQVKTDIFADRERVEQGAGLKHHRHPIFVHHAGRLNRFAFDQNFAFVRRFQADDVFEQNAFAAAAWAHHDKNFSAIHLKAQTFEHGLAEETAAQSPDGDAHAMLGGNRGIHQSRYIRKRVTK